MNVKKENYDLGRTSIDLTGPEGNAFVLMAYAKKFANQLGYDAERILEEMTSGNYDNLVGTFDDYFGEFVTLLR